MRSTPTAACEVDANIEPLDIRRERATLETVERYKRMNPHHPNRELVENWRPEGRLQKKSPLMIAEAAYTKHHLPEEREPIPSCSLLQPGLDLRYPEIKTALVDENVTKETNPLILKACTLETIDSYSRSAIHIYTDGSAFKATVNAGFGIFYEIS